MSPHTALDLIIFPTLGYLGPPYNSPRASLMLLTIGITESNFKHRIQVKGPARGPWQFERGGGASEFEKEPKLFPFRLAAIDLGFTITRDATMHAIGCGADHLACIMARAVLWLEPHPLPLIGDRQEAYRQYLARWRPGKRDEARFTNSYETATRVLAGAMRDLIA